MRYPLNAHSKELASADEARERERELVSIFLPSASRGSQQLIDLMRSCDTLQAKEIEEGDSDAGMDGPGDMDSF